jgi:WD40 repeat protein
MRLFISYSSDERAEALAVQSWLEQNGWENDVFVDVDPQHGLTGGEAWRTALREAAGRCEAVILLLSPAWLASKPCWNEFQLAEKYGKPCIPVRVDDAVAMKELPREITNNYQVIDKASTPPAEFEMRLKRALEAAGAGPENFSLPTGRRPYPGLEALTELDAALLFGRDADVLAALDTLREIRSTGRKRLFVLLGASGAGKSSLMRAGIWPRLYRDDRNFIALPTVRPSHAVLSGKEGLWQALESGMADQRRARHLSGDTPRTRAAIRLAVENDPNGLAHLFNEMKQAALQSMMDKNAAAPSVVLAIDQGEELFNPEGVAEAEMFLRLLAPAWNSDPHFIALIAIRSDVYPQLQADRRIEQQHVRPFNLAPMAAAGLLQVIEGPARRIGLVVEPGLTAALLRDSQGADALPLLAFTLERLFDQRLQDKRLVLGDYARMGGVKGAIEAAADKARAEAVAQGVPGKDFDTLLRRTFLPHLVRVNEAGEFARRVAQLSELNRDCLPLVTVLVAQRLLVADQKGEVKTVEIAHEAILREWPLLRGWLDAERSFLEWRDQVGRARRLHERDQGDLLTGRALAVTQGFLETRRDAIQEPDRNFIEASIAAETRRREAEEAAKEARRQAELNAAKAREEAALASAAAEKKIAETARRTTGRMRALAAAMTLLAVVAAGAGYLAFVNGHAAKSEAERATTEAKRATDAADLEKSARAESDSRRVALVAEAVRAATGDDKALALAWLALPHDDAMKSRPLTNEAASAVYSRSAQLLGSLPNSLDTIFSSNGDVAVTVLNDGHAELWDTRTRRVLRTLNDLRTDFDTRKDANSDPSDVGIQYSGFDQGSVPLYFLPGGNELVTLHVDDVVRAWDLASPSHAPKYELSLPKAMIGRAVFSTDGSYLFGITKDGAGFVWQLASGKQVLSFRKKKLIDGTFSEDGAYLFAFTDLNSGTVFRLEDGRELFSIPEPQIARNGYSDWHGTGEAHFSRATGRLLTTTASRGRDAYLWDLKTGRQIAKLTTESGDSGYGDQFEFKFINDGKLVLIGAAESSTIGWIWNAANGQLVRKLDGYAGVVKKQGEDRILRLVDGKVVVTKLDGQDELHFGRGFNVNQVSDLPIDFETNSALVGGRINEGALQLWDIKADTVRASLGRIARDGSGSGFQFSPDGLQILTENDDGNARLWDTRSGALLATLMSDNNGLAAEESRFSPDGGSVVLDLMSATPNYRSAASLSKSAETLIWTLRGNPVLQLGSPTRAAAFSPDGSRVLITAEDNSANIRLTKGKAVVAELKGHASTIVSAVFSRDGAAVLTGAWDSTGRIWDATTGEPKTTLKGHASGLTQVTFSPDGKLALTASHDAMAKLWDVQTGTLKATLAGHRGSVLAASFSPDGRRIVTASTDETAAVWNAETGSRLATLVGHTGALFGARFSPDGNRILTASEDHTAKIWDATTGAVLATLEAHGGMVNDAQWSPDGATILTVSSDKTGVLWDASTLKARVTLKGHLGPVTRAAFSPDGKQAATISEDRTVRLWDVETGALLATYAGHDKTIHALVFTRDGRTVVTTSSDGTARLWTVFPGSLKERIAEVGKLVSRLHPLTKDECEQHDVVALPGADLACAAK